MLGKHFLPELQCTVATLVLDVFQFKLLEPESQSADCAISDACGHVVFGYLRA